MRFHHLGIATKDIGVTAQFLLASHNMVFDSGEVFDPLQNAHLRLLVTATGLTFELVSGPVVRRLIDRGVSYYHICYEVNELESTIRSLQRQGCMLVAKPTPAVLFEQKRVAFLYTPLGLIELLERQ